MTVSARAQALVVELQRELGVSVECGDIRLNINQHVCGSVDVRLHGRAASARRTNDLDTPGRSA